jgi:hypothetical protein
MAIAASLPLGSIIPYRSYFKVYTSPTLSLEVVPPMRAELLRTMNVVLARSKQNFCEKSMSTIAVIILVKLAISLTL